MWRLLRAGLVAALALTLVAGQGAVQPAAAQDYGVVTQAERALCRA